MKESTVDARNDIIAGSARGVAQVFAGHPLDTLKVRLQTQNQMIGLGKPIKYKSLSHCIRTTYLEEGFAGFWKGWTSPTAGCALYSASLFLAYGQAKRIVGMDENNPSYKDLIIVGSLTGGAAAFIECPIDLIKGRLQVQSQEIERGNLSSTKLYRGSMDCATKIIKQRGITGIYQGFGATLIRNVPGTVAYFSSYELMKASIQGNGLSDSMNTLLAGGTAGILYWLAIFPADVVKSCIQTDHLQPEKRVYRSVREGFTKILKTKGIKGLFSGFSACAIRAFPVNGASFFVYEFVRKRLPG